MRYLGLDWGLKKIGLAVSEGEIATPLKTITANNFEGAIVKTINLIEEEMADVMILGQPEGKIGEIVKKVADRLKSEGFEVILVDETLTTWESRSLMIQMGLREKTRRDDNAVAAAIILQRYLDEKK